MMVCIAVHVAILTNRTHDMTLSYRPIRHFKSRQFLRDRRVPRRQIAQLNAGMTDAENNVYVTHVTLCQFCIFRRLSHILFSSMTPTQCWSWTENRRHLGCYWIRARMLDFTESKCNAWNEIITADSSFAYVMLKYVTKCSNSSQQIAHNIYVWNEVHAGNTKLY